VKWKGPTVGIVCAIACAALAPSIAQAAPTCQTGTVTFTSTGAEQCYVVPAGVSQLTTTAVGAPGGAGATGLGVVIPGMLFSNAPGGAGGDGAVVNGRIAVTPGETLYVEVGGAGAPGQAITMDGPVFIVAPGGFNGGGASGPSIGLDGGGGGGASDVRTCSSSAASCPGGGNTLTSRLLVAAGGAGGAGGGTFYGSGANGGAGGLVGGDGGTGGPGDSTAGGGGGGGHATAGGSGGVAGACPQAQGPAGAPGALGFGGAGAGPFPEVSPGGGGGGLYGGGGGGSGGCVTVTGGIAGTAPGGGGGGSSFGPAGATVATDTTGTPLVTFVPAPVVQATTPAAFGTTPQGEISAPATITVTSPADETLSVTGLSFAGADPGDFIIGSDGCLGPVAPGASCTVTVNFTPQAQGTRTATLEIATNDPSSPATVSLSGTGGPLPQGPAGPAGSAGPQGATGPAGTIVCQNTSIARALCELEFAPGTFKFAIRHDNVVVVRGTLHGRHGRIVRNLRPGRYTLTLTAGKRVVLKRVFTVR